MLEIDDTQEFIDEFNDVLGVEKAMIITNEELKRRTIQQNKALHKYFRLLAKELNRQEVDMREVLTKRLPADEHIVKEYMWKPVQRAMFDTDSTASLEARQVNQVLEVFTKFLGERLGVYVEFPSEDKCQE